MEINRKTCDCFTELPSQYVALLPCGHGHSGASLEFQPQPFTCDASNEKGCAHSCVLLPGEVHRWPAVPVPPGYCHSARGWNGAVHPHTALTGVVCNTGGWIWDGLWPQDALHSVVSKHANSLELFFF